MTKEEKQKLIIALEEMIKKDKELKLKIIDIEEMKENVLKILEEYDEYLFQNFLNYIKETRKRLLRSYNLNNAYSSLLKIIYNYLLATDCFYKRELTRQEADILHTNLIVLYINNNNNKLKNLIVEIEKTKCLNISIKTDF